jgi:hypothetical protein
MEASSKLAAEKEDQLYADLRRRGIRSCLLLIFLWIGLGFAAFAFFSKGDIGVGALLVGIILLASWFYGEGGRV